MTTHVDVNLLYPITVVAGTNGNHTPEWDTLMRLQEEAPTREEEANQAFNAMFLVVTDPNTGRKKVKPAPGRKLRRIK